jgi:hypothetical protein
MKTAKPDGRRRDDWVYACRKSPHQIGDVTIVLSKQRRSDSPKKTKIIVTNLETATTADTLSHYARRWGVEVTFKELKSGLHLGRMQVTKEKARVARSVALPVLAYVLLLRLYGKEEPQCGLFKLKQRFAVEVYKKQVTRTERRWQAKLDKYRLAA